MKNTVDFPEFKFQELENGETIVTGRICACEYISHYILLWNGKKDKDFSIIKCYCKAFIPIKPNQKIKLQGRMVFYNDGNHDLFNAIMVK